MSGRAVVRPPGGDGLVDVLERVLDKGLVIAGDVRVNLLDIELLTIKVRLLVASVDTAQQLGIDWWRHDPFLAGGGGDRDAENAALRDRVARLEQLVGDAGASLEAGDDGDGEDGRHEEGDGEDGDDA